MILNNMKKPDLDNEVTITLTERELLMLTAAIRRISPIDCRSAIKDVYNLNFDRDTIADDVYALCDEMVDAMRSLGYNANY